jgi:hypothetical protein
LENPHYQQAKIFFANHKRSAVAGVAQYLGIKESQAMRICNKLVKEGYIRESYFNTPYGSKSCFRLVNEDLYDQDEIKFPDNL